MLGIGPIWWRRVNREIYNNSNASGAEPVCREDAAIITDRHTAIEKYRYESPAARRYYLLLDDFNARRGAGTGEAK